MRNSRVVLSSVECTWPVGDELHQVLHGIIVGAPTQQFFVANRVADIGSIEGGLEDLRVSQAQALHDGLTHLLGAAGLQAEHSRRIIGMVLGM